MSKNLKRIVPVIALAVGLVLSPMLEGSASALTHYKVGTITARYYPTGNDFSGLVKARSQGDQCVTVQRKSIASGIWGEAGLYGGQDCIGVDTSWAFKNDADVNDTAGIRSYVYSGNYRGSLLVICSSNADCKSMLKPR